MAKFVHNKSTSNVSLLDGRILLPVGAKQSVSDVEAESESVLHAARMGWVSVEGSKSITPTPESVSGITLAEDKMKGSTTIPKAKAKAEPAVTSTKLGTEPEPFVPAEIAPTTTTKGNK